MDRTQQRTVRATVTLDGIGVHSGEEASLTFRPAPPDTGILFRRIDLDGCPEVPADLNHVVNTELGTSIGRDGVQILTVEHVLASLAANGVDNVILDLRGPEPPIRDGSFRDYCEALGEAGLEEQDRPARVIRLREPLSIQVEKGESYAAFPGEKLRISAAIDFAHPAIGRQIGSFELSTELFQREIASARTFGFRAEGEALRARGLAKGASLTNTIVLDDTGIMNDGLRFEDEYLRHKVGDIVGDMALLGARLEGHLMAERPSHSGNVQFARELARRFDARQVPAIVDAQKIMQYLPHRYPMLLVDRVVEFEAGKRIVGIKNVTINEPFFQGHYPDHPVMPGVLIIEAMAQCGGLLLMDAVEDPSNKVVYFMTLDKVKWRRPVTPGDQIVFELEMLQFRRHVCKMKGTGSVDGHVVAEAELMARIVDR